MIGSPDASARPGRFRFERRHLIFIVLAATLLMSSIDFTIVAVALKAIRHDLNTSILWSGWTVTAYSLGQLLVLPVSAALSDKLGRKRVLLAAVLIFTVSSLLCGLAPNVYALIVFRLIQAVGGATFFPACVGITSDEFKQNRMQMIGVIASIQPLGSIVGPNVGGVLVDSVSWRAVFLVNIPIGVLVFVLVAVLVHEGTSSETEGLDYRGALYYGAAIVILLLALTWLGDHPGAAGSPLLWAAFALGAAMLVVFWRWEGRARDPIVDPALLKRRAFLGANLYALFYGAGAFGFAAFIPTFVQLAYNTSAGVAGALLTPRAIVMVASGTLASLFIIRLGYRIPMVVGVLLQALSLALFAGGFHHVHLLGIALSDVAWLSLVLVISGLAFGFSQPASQNAALDLMPGKVASVTGVRQVFNLTGGVFSTALISLVMTHFKGDEVDGYEHVFTAIAVIYVCIVPIVFMIPDTARQRRRAALASPDGAGIGAGEPEVVSRVAHSDF